MFVNSLCNSLVDSNFKKSFLSIFSFLTKKNYKPEDPKPFTPLSEAKSITSKKETFIFLKNYLCNMISFFNDVIII